MGNSRFFNIDYTESTNISSNTFFSYLTNEIISLLKTDKSYICYVKLINILTEVFEKQKKLEDLNREIDSEVYKYKSMNIINAHLKFLENERQMYLQQLELDSNFNKFKNFNFANFRDIATSNNMSISCGLEETKEILERSLFSAVKRTLSDNNAISNNTLCLIQTEGVFSLSLEREFNYIPIVDFGTVQFSENTYKAYNLILDNEKKLVANCTKTSGLPVYLQSLNEKQRIAVMQPLGQILVLAGAGCGKTKTIIARASYLISNGCSPERIRILTFTKKAAYEITKRIVDNIGQISYGLKASTFHRWCIDIIKATPEIFGYENFTILDRDDQLEIFKKMRGTPKKNELPRASDICDLYSYARNTKKALSSAMEDRLSKYFDKYFKIATIMENYEKEKKRLAYLDYDDILDIVSTAINQDERVCKWLGEQYDCILIDEMQDTNPLQWSLLKPLTKYTNLFCVGDDAQAIYGFRGADFRNIHDFKNRIPDATILRLEDNYRSTQEILDLSNWLLSKSDLQYDKKLIAVKGHGKKPQLHSFMNKFDEAAWMADYLHRRKTKGGKYNDVMVLTRSAYSGRNIETELLKKSIPYIFIGGQKLFESAHIKDVMSLMRIAYNYKDEVAWLRFLTLFHGIGTVKATKLIGQIVSTNTKEDAVELLKNSLIENCNILFTLKIMLLDDKSLHDKIIIATDFLNDILLSKYGELEWEARKKDIQFLEELSASYVTLSEFLEEYLLDPVFNSQQDMKDIDDYVTISTIHSAKGTERECVIISNVSVGSYPKLRDAESEDSIEEERRVLYVAMTRAKTELIITKSEPDLFYVPYEMVGYLERKYFLYKLPKNLITAKRHNGRNYLQNVEFVKSYDNVPRTTQKRFSARIVNVNLKKPSAIKKINCTGRSTEYDKLNYEIVNYMKTRQEGEKYPKEIKEAVISEYIPNIYGSKRIGKKYGINPDVIKSWVRNKI